MIDANSTSGQSPTRAAAMLAARSRLRLRSARASDASAASEAENCSSMTSAICRCSSRGGIGIVRLPKFFLEIRLRVVPDCRASILARIGGELMNHISHLSSRCRPEGAECRRQTTVIARRGSPGNIQALPSGSGIRATNTSPTSRYVQLSRVALSRVRLRFERFRQHPSPTSASCVRRSLHSRPDLWFQPSRRQ